MIEFHEEKCYICGNPKFCYCDVCDEPLCEDHSRRVADDTDVCPTHDNPEDIEKAIERREEMKRFFDYETTYGSCIAKNPYWFIPDLECNTDAELISWRHALFAVKQGTFKCPEHYFYKTVDASLSKQELSDIMNDCHGVISTFSDENGKMVIHGHNTPWGMGISAYTDKINVWDEYPKDKWLLKLAESDIPDQAFIAIIRRRLTQQKQAYEEWKRKEGMM